MGKGFLGGKTALITGGARRIGREIALALASEGADIVIHYKDSAGEAESLRLELEKKGVKCSLIKADFENEKDYKNLISASIEKIGSLDILINSASLFPTDTVMDLKWEGLIKNIRINAWAPFYLSREFALKVKNGVIINLLDSRIKGFNKKHVSYLFGKKMLESFTKLTALEFAPGIRVNGIAPGLILPPAGKDEKYLNGLSEAVPLKRHGSVRDITETVLFLIKSEFITGEIIFVDGGWHLTAG